MFLVILYSNCRTLFPRLVRIVIIKYHYLLCDFPNVAVTYFFRGYYVLIINSYQTMHKL